MATRIDRRLRTDRLTPEASDRRPHKPLTRREQHVLRGIFAGLPNKQIAADLGVSEGAVKATLQHLFRKTHVRTRAQLVRIAIEGSIDMPRRA
jgi:DNA-binding NarL/FixJ family response regulator